MNYIYIKNQEVGIISIEISLSIFSIRNIFTYYPCSYPVFLPPKTEPNFKTGISNQSNPQWHSNIRPSAYPFYLELDQQSVSKIGLPKVANDKKNDIGKRMGPRLILFWSIYTLPLCRGHSWRVRLAKQETLTPPGHLVSPLLCRGPWMSTVVLYCWCHSDSASVLLYFTCFIFNNYSFV